MMGTYAMRAVSHDAVHIVLNGLVNDIMDGIKKSNVALEKSSRISGEANAKGEYVIGRRSGCETVDLQKSVTVIHEFGRVSFSSVRGECVPVENGGACCALVDGAI